MHVVLKRIVGAGVATLLAVALCACFLSLIVVGVRALGFLLAYLSIGGLTVVGFEHAIEDNRLRLIVIALWPLWWLCLIAGWCWGKWIAWNR